MVEGKRLQEEFSSEPVQSVMADGHGSQSSVSGNSSSSSSSSSRAGSTRPTEVRAPSAGFTSNRTANPSDSSLASGSVTPPKHVETRREPRESVTFNASTEEDVSSGHDVPLTPKTKRSHSVRPYPMTCCTVAVSAVIILMAGVASVLIVLFVPRTNLQRGLGMYKRTTPVLHPVWCPLPAVANDTKHSIVYRQNVRSLLGGVLYRRRRIAVEYAFSMPVQISDEPQPIVTNSFFAIVLPDVPGNLTFFYVTDQCSEASVGQIRKLEESRADLDEFEENLSELSENSTKIASYTCWRKPIGLKSGFVQSNSFRVRVSVDVSSNFVLLETCQHEDEPDRCATSLMLTLNATPTFTDYVFTTVCHAFWNGQHQYEKDFFIHDYVTASSRCFVYD